jgi:hypothetical protein
MSKKKRDPGTDPDPQPGDFDEWLANAGPDDIEVEVLPPGSVKFVFIGNEDPDEYIRRKRAERPKAS